MFRIAAHTDIGPKKKSNQDSSLAEVAQTPFGDTAILAVCDGVGGLSAGELASGTVIGWLSDWFEGEYPALLGAHEGNPSAVLDAVQEQWASGLYRLNDRLRSYGRDNGIQLGTTCTALLLFGESYLIVHVGDSRVYLFRDHAMDILTMDQTWVAQEVARGNIPKEQARTHPKRNIILQSVGTQAELEPVFGRGQYTWGDTFMLCCDGFRNELFDDEVTEAFGNLQEANEAVLRSTCESLVQLVLQRGERDNVSVVVVSCQETGSYAPAGQQPGNDDATTVLTPATDDDATTQLPQTSSEEAGD